MFQRRTIRWSAAAALALLVAGGIWAVLGPSTRPAYAFSQTLAAMQQVYRVHLIGRDWDDRQVEMWIEMSPEDSQTRSFRIDEKDSNRLTVGTEQRAYYYDRSADTVRIVEGGALETWIRWGHLQEDLGRWAALCGDAIEYSTTTDAAGRELYVARFMVDGVRIESVADPQTMLPVRYHFAAPPGRRLPVPLKDVDSITYPDEFPPDLFTFDVPATARVLAGEPQLGRDLADEMLAGDIIGFAMLRHRQTQEFAGGSPPDEQPSQSSPPPGWEQWSPSWIQEFGHLPVNTRIFVVDESMRLRQGGILYAANSTGQPADEVTLGGFNNPDVSLFDETGTRQRTRAVQKTLMPRGRFWLVWLPDEALDPGASRCLFYACNESTPLATDPAGRGHSLKMNNHFGSEVLENFILVVPAGMPMVESSEAPQTQTTIGGYDVFVWFKHNPRDTTNEVRVVLGSIGNSQR